MSTDNITFGGFLAQKREERDITLRELARQLEVPASFLSDVENNRKPPLTADRLERVASIMLLSADEKSKMYGFSGQTTQHRSARLTRIHYRTRLCKCYSPNCSRPEYWRGG